MAAGFADVVTMAGADSAAIGLTVLVLEQAASVRQIATVDAEASGVLMSDLLSGVKTGAGQRAFTTHSDKVTLTGITGTIWLHYENFN